VNTSRRLSLVRSGVSAAMVAAVLAAGCAPAVHVRTELAPDANLASARTFRFLRTGGNGPVASVGPNGAVNNTSTGEVTAGNPARATNPILENSITLDQLRHDLEQAMLARGYRPQPDDADLSIAYYIGVRQRLQVNDYGYGYPFWGWRWQWGPGWGAWPAQEVTTYEQGTVIIDVLDGAGRRLVWRGMGRMQVPSDERDYDRAIDEAVNAVMARFPPRSAGT
jgi:hypothetical protein